MNYIIEVNVGIAVLYGAYLLLLRKENDFRKQRIALLSVLACTLMFPLIKMPAAAQMIPLTTITLPEIVVGRSGSSVDFTLIYFMITLAIGVPGLFSVIKLYRIAKGKGRYVGSYFIIESNKPVPSWSFFNLIFIGRANELSDEDKDLIIKHEMLHGKLLHSIDMVVITLLCTIFWFNPLWWLYRRSMAKIHEFEVDAIIAEQNGPANYSMLLAKTALSRNGFLLAHHFNQSFILKRINMINMIKTKISNWKLGSLAAVIVIYSGVIACTDPSGEKIDKSGEVFTIVDNTAMPVNGMTGFYEDLGAVLQYPEQARNEGVSGKVFVEIIVNKHGELSDFKVLKGIGAGCDAAALKALAAMKPWTPGTHKGLAVRQKMVLPITFRLN